MQATSLIGFALAFLVASVVGSTLLGSAVLVSRPWLRAAGPRAERRAAAYAILLPPLLSLALVTVLAGYSVVGPWMGLEDHCPQHLHHLHLCLFHGANWASEGWAVATVALLAFLVATRIVHHVITLWRARAGLKRIARVSRRLSSPAGEILLAPASTPFCFVAGLFKPRIFVSSAAWERLDDEERRAMLAHEMAHAEQGDLWRGSALRMSALFGAPWISSQVVAVWNAATERLCDHRAAIAVGEPEFVARALVSLSRTNGLVPRSATACFVPNRNDVIERVEAVLAARGDGRLAAQRMAIAAAILTASVLVGTTALAGPIHHALESLLGIF